jgi:hypothetical protein
LDFSWAWDSKWSYGHIVSCCSTPKMGRLNDNQYSITELNDIRDVNEYYNFILATSYNNSDDNNNSNTY